MFKLGLENFIDDSLLRKSLSGQRLALLIHPASNNQKLVHSVDLIAGCKELTLSTLFSPQHGFHGDKQDNMIESDHSLHPQHNLPIFSLYGKTRRPSQKVMQNFDTLIVDLQDVGTRIYTYLTTLFYMIEACEEHKKNILILDRPNPAGRPIEGPLLDMKLESFVGAAPLVMRHGLTLGEVGLWYIKHKKFSIDLKVIKMSGYNILSEPWPQELTWINPSPNLPRISSCNVYPGTVLLEGTTLSEGRGTTRPFEMVGAPDVDFKKVYELMKELQASWLEHCLIRPCQFEPQFQKHSKTLCSGLHFHTDNPVYERNKFKPFRLTCLLLKALRTLHPQYKLFQVPPYEYETIEKPFDIISGDKRIYNWVEDLSSTCKQLDEMLLPQEQQWLEQSRPHYLY